MSAPPAWRRSALIVLLALVVLAPVTWQRELIPPDEPRFALVGKEMAESGDFVVLTRGGRLYTDKPPLLFWAQALLFRASDAESPFLARLPCLLATLFGIGLLHRAALRWFGEPLATRGALVYLSCALVIQRGAWVATDALLAAAVFASVDFLDRAREGSRAWSAASGLALALALLAKGPVGLVLVAMACLAGLAAPGAFSLRRVPALPLLGTFALVASVWPLLWMGRQGGASGLIDALWSQNVGRFVDSWDNLEPWWFHARGLVLGLLPWSLFAWVGLAPRRLQAAWRTPRLRWLLLWSLAAFVFFSIPGSKRAVYLLPVYGPVSLLLAHLLTEALASRRARLLAGLTALATALLTGSLALLAASGAPPLPAEIAGEPAVRRGAATLLALFAGACAWSGLALWRRSPRQVFAGPLLLALGSGLLAQPLINPAINEGQGARAFAADFRAAMPPDAALLLGRTKWELMAWYLDETLPWTDSREALVRHLAATGVRAVAAAEKDLPPRVEWPPGTRVACDRRLGRARMLLLVREAPSPRSRLSSDDEREAER